MIKLNTVKITRFIPHWNMLKIWYVPNNCYRNSSYRCESFCEDVDPTPYITNGNFKNPKIFSKHTRDFFKRYL